MTRSPRNRRLPSPSPRVVVAQDAFERAKVDIDRATGSTLDRMGVSLDDAKSGVVSHM